MALDIELLVVYYDSHATVPLYICRKAVMMIYGDFMLFEGKGYSKKDLVGWALGAHHRQWPVAVTIGDLVAAASLDKSTSEWTWTDHVFVAVYRVAAGRGVSWRALLFPVEHGADGEACSVSADLKTAPASKIWPAERPSTCTCVLCCATPIHRFACLSPSHVQACV